MSAAFDSNSRFDSSMVTLVKKKHLGVRRFRFKQPVRLAGVVFAACARCVSAAFDSNSRFDLGQILEPHPTQRCPPLSIQTAGSTCWDPFRHGLRVVVSAAFDSNSRFDNNLANPSQTLTLCPPLSIQTAGSTNLAEDKLVGNLRVRRFRFKQPVRQRQRKSARSQP